MAYIRKGLQFDTDNESQARAAEVLTLAGRKQSVFVAALIDNFLRTSGFENTEDISREELDAALINAGRLLGNEISLASARPKRLAPRNYTKPAPKRNNTHLQTPVNRVTEVSAIPVEDEADDAIDDEMAKMLNAFG